MDFEKIMSIVRKRNMSAYFAKDHDEASAIAIKIAEEYAKSEGKTTGEVTVSSGGSVSLAESGVKSVFEAAGYKMLNPRVNPEDKKRIADIFLTSTNAITEDGELVNIDGNGNRVSAMIYGPDRVIFIVGKNKIAASLEDAYNRVKEIACPKNAVRLNRETPCAKYGKCTPCLIPGQTMCAHTVITRFSSVSGRVHIIFTDETLGY